MLVIEIVWVVGKLVFVMSEISSFSFSLIDLVVLLLVVFDVIDLLCMLVGEVS